MAHTPGPWSVGWNENETLSVLGPGSVVVAYPVIPDSNPYHVAVDKRDANQRLLCLAPTAPHDCDLPSCPGAENKRKLEAAEKLYRALHSISEFWAYALTKSDGAELTDADHAEAERLGTVSAEALNAWEAA